jgi:hypothetical protein
MIMQDGRRLPVFFLFNGIASEKDLINTTTRLHFN